MPICHEFTHCATRVSHPLNPLSFLALFSFQSFREQSIDGTGLPLLTEDHLVNSLGMKLGPALKLRSILAKKLGGPCPCVACVAQAQQILALQTGGAAPAGTAGAAASGGTESGAAASSSASATGATTAITSCSIKSEIFNGGSNGSSSRNSNQSSDIAAQRAASNSPSGIIALPELPCNDTS